VYAGAGELVQTEYRDAPAEDPIHDRPGAILSGRATRHPHRREPTWLKLRFLPGLAVVIVAGAIRLPFPNAYDVFLDEIYYADITTSFKSGHYPPHFANQGPFLLHPPLLFIIGALWQDIVPHGTTYFQIIDSMRLLEGICAVVTALFIFLIGARLANRWIGMVGGILYAVDPYILRINGRVLLETVAVMFVMAGYLTFLRLVPSTSMQPTTTSNTPSMLRSKSPRHLRSKRPRVHMRAACAGFLLGLGTVTLEITGLIVLGPLLVLLWRKWGVDRKTILTAVLAAITPYCAYLGSLIATGNLSALYSQDRTGFERFFGLVHTPGSFGTKSQPTLLQTLIDQIPTFGTTYALVGIGIAAAIYLVFQKDARRKVLGVFTLFGTITVFYEAAVGAVEEQFLFILMIPICTSVGLAAHTLATRFNRRRFLRIILVVLFSAVAVYDLGVDTYIRAHSDNGLYRVVTFLKQKLPDPGTVGTNALEATFVLEHSGINALSVTTPRLTRNAHVRYFVVLTAELNPGYGTIDAAQAQYYTSRGRVIFSFKEATYGEVLVYQSTAPGAW
jgi:4-amino-4-deoxy-L-arabinose transferase-like glycosyltransferase